MSSSSSRSTTASPPPPSSSDEELDNDDDEEEADNTEPDPPEPAPPADVVELNSIGQRYLECGMLLEAEGAFLWALALLRSSYPRVSGIPIVVAPNSRVTVDDLTRDATFPPLLVRHPSDALHAATLLWYDHHDAAADGDAARVIKSFFV